ncbi:hypothetical protein COJ96_07890 [Bacillus sp. AFS073361]|uniref:hypothetical protein n=1 Tax=Bacillus sp. AFS073361 TaxID=2033511 RepID=UPI000BF7FD04|nr:hypothetical protein [Bacillus sp. AFS073361]PFP30102.1 hypothetical protein COJ96_07890 [Bacillus sp. AFS073361]
MSIFDFIKTFATPIFGLIGVFVGSKLSAKREIKLQKEFLSRKLRIEKYQEFSLDLSDFIREGATSLSRMVDLIKGEITHKEFRQLNDSSQAEAIRICRRLMVNQWFIPDEYRDRYEKVYDNYNVIFEGFHEPDTPKRNFKDHEITYEAIKRDIESFLTIAVNVYEDLNNELKKELEGLK